jgi:hypothetical protein
MYIPMAKAIVAGMMVKAIISLSMGLFYAFLKWESTVSGVHESVESGDAWSLRVCRKAVGAPVQRKPYVSRATRGLNAIRCTRWYETFPDSSDTASSECNSMRFTLLLLVLAACGSSRVYLLSSRQPALRIVCRDKHLSECKAGDKDPKCCAGHGGNSNTVGWVD